MYMVLSNSTDKFRQVRVSSMRMSNQHKTWCLKPCLVGEKRYNSSRRDEDEPDSHSHSSLLNFLRAFGDGPVAGVSGGQGIESWLACLEFEPSATKDPPCRAAMHVKSIES
ncbi:hypothetical protein TNCV_637251 [Trichonephila clavipes]|nr:hypothetical protein TNCV_637251 [Trichonephila clavipes]